MNILIDIGGSGIKVADYKNGVIGRISSYNHFSNYTEFVRLIKDKCMGERLRGLAISTAGFANPEEGQIISCKCAPYLEGYIVRKLKNDFPFCKVVVINDGEAHARALLSPKRNVKFGAIHLALGTSPAFGVINSKREIVRTCSGENWDIGDFQLRTKEKPYEVWYKLGADGLRDLEENLAGDAYYHYGMRLGALLKNLAVIFRPATIGLSGGIIISHSRAIMDGVRSEYQDPVRSRKVDFVIIDSQNAAMEGLTTLL